MNESRATFERIPISKLLLDPQNPRLPKSMANNNEKEIINFFLTDASLIELMLAIGKNGFFEGEQLLVVQSSDNYVVIEGNRRLSAVKLLHNPGIAENYKNKVSQVLQETDPANIPNEIPCLIFKEKEDILKYLGYRHITGIKSWRLLEKARYIRKIRDDFYPNEKPNNASREIAKMIGSRRDYVLRILTGYALYETIENNGFYGIKGWDDTNFHFNYIADSLSRNNIEKFLGVDLEKDDPTTDINYKNLEEWTQWFFDKDRPNKIIGDSVHLNQLNKILDKKYSSALNAFRQGEELRIAYEYTDGIKEQFERAIENAIKHLEKADSLSHKQVEFKKSLEDDLKNISGIIRKIKSIKDEIESDNLGI